MKQNYFIFFLFLAGFLTLNSATAQKLITFDDIPGRNPSTQYECRVRQVGNTEWQTAFVLQTTCKHNPRAEGGVDNGYYETLDGWTASWITFEFENTSVEVEISKIGGTITKAMVRPVGEASAAEIIDGKAYITFTEPANINVDINGQMEDQYTGMEYTGEPVHSISIFANPVFRKPDVSNSNVLEIAPGDPIPERYLWDTLIFKPGIHDIGNAFPIYSNEVLYIPGNAVLHGTIHPPDSWGNSAAKNFAVYGSGAISGENNVWTGDEVKENKTFTYQATGVRLEGFVVIDPANHTFNMNNTELSSENTNVYKNLKILAWRKNSDAINAFRNSDISECFFRVQDDAFYYGTNVKMYKTTVWNDANGAVLYLTKGDPDNKSFFKDIKVIYHRSQWHYWAGGKVISMRECNPGRDYTNVLIQNVLIEDPFPAFPPFYGKMIEGSSEPITFNNVLIENVHQEHLGVARDKDATRGKLRNQLLGLDAQRKFENITFKNCYYNGKYLRSFEDGDFLTNDFVDENTIEFIVDENTSINNEKKSETVTIYPNPAGNNLNIDFKTNKPFQINLYNSSGQLIYTKATRFSHTIDLKELNAKGLVFVRIKSNKSVDTYKVLVK